MADVDVAHPPTVLDAGLAQRTLDSYAGRGFTGTFSVRPGGELRCGTCGRVVPAARVALRDMTRIDVATDPGDQSVVAALECAACGALGTYVFSYGAAASAEDAEAFGRLREARKRP